MTRNGGIKIGSTFAPKGKACTLKIASTAAHITIAGAKKIESVSTKPGANVGEHGRKRRRSRPRV